MADPPDDDEGRRADGAPPVIDLAGDEVSIADVGLIDAPGLIVFWVLAIVVFLQFFTRYVLNDSLAWTEEAARYLLVLVCFLGSVSAVRRGSHIKLEFLFRMVPPVWAKVLAIVAEATTLGFFGLITWIGIELTQKTRQKMVTVPVPKAWIYWICVVALAAMTVYSAIWLWRKVKSSPEEVVAALDHSARLD
jgi:TRAP-type C4-dicarboxylate transport system permease small subunit